MSRDFNNDASKRLECGDTAALDITGTALSMHAWINRQGGGAVAGKRNAAGTVLQYELRIVSGAVYFLCGDGAGTFDDITGATTVAIGSWAAVGAVKNGTGADAQKVYLNGVQDASETSNVTIGATNQQFLIGVLGLDTPSTPFFGLLCEVGVWNIALTPQEFAALGKGVSPLLIRPQNLQGYWPMYGTGSPEPDYSGKGSHGTIAGSLAAGTRHAPVMPFVPPIVTQLPNPAVTLVTAEPTFQQSLYGVPTLKRPQSLKRLRIPEPADDFETGIVAETIDAATVYVDIQASGTELRESVDAATVYVDITNTGGECYTSFTGEFLGEGEAFVEFFAEFDELEWSSSDDFLEWSPGVPVVEEEHC